MIGNDVVDICQSRLDSNWQRKGFIQKLFTEEEQLLIANNLDTEMIIWLLWSMKEAAYKIWNRQTKIREYIPRKLVCTLLTQNSHSATGQVVCCGNIYHTKSSLSKEFLHTIAVIDFQALEHVIEIDSKSMLKYENGIPYQITEDQWRPVSVSNHGRFEKVVTLKAHDW